MAGWADKCSPRHRSELFCNALIQIFVMYVRISSAQYAKDRCVLTVVCSISCYAIKEGKPADDWSDVKWLLSAMDYSLKEIFCQPSDSSPSKSEKQKKYSVP